VRILDGSGIDAEEVAASAPGAFGLEIPPSKSIVGGGRRVWAQPTR
jgi:hypothetical protein